MSDAAIPDAAISDAAISDAAISDAAAIAPGAPPRFLRVPKRRDPPDIDSPVNWLLAKLSVASARRRSQSAMKAGRAAAALAATLVSSTDQDIATRCARSRASLRVGGMKGANVVEGLALAAE